MNLGELFNIEIELLFWLYCDTKSLCLVFIVVGLFSTLFILSFTSLFRLLSLVSRPTMVENLSALILRLDLELLLMYYLDDLPP